MSLWVDKHRPSSLNKLDYHKEQAQWLKRLVSLQFDQKYIDCRKMNLCHVLSNVHVGSEWGFPSFASVWSFWSWEEDANHVCSS